MGQGSGVPTLREQQRAFTRQRLMDAGSKVFAAQGYPDASVDDIAREAGASRATFYLHFTSKCELMIALIDEWAPYAVGTYRALDELLEKGGPQLPERLRSWLAQWLNVWTSEANANHAVLQASMLEPEVESRHLRLSGDLIDALVRYRDRTPGPERATARHRALVLEMMTQRIFALASMSRLPVAEDRLLDILTAMWLDVFAADGLPRGLCHFHAERAVTALEEDERRGHVSGQHIERSHASEHDVVIASLYRSFEVAIDPGERAIQDRCSGWRSVPADAGELVRAGDRELPAQ